MEIGTKRELAALSRIFSPAVIREIASSGRSPLLARLLTESRISELLVESATLADAFEAAFLVLRKLGNRDDYVYRTAITQKIVLGRHNLRTATVLNELRAGSSKADVVVLNGTATAYEIKSERDSFQRLDRQLADYRSIFASVNVVTSPAQANAVLRIAPEDVGVLALTSRFQLHLVRRAIDLPERTSPRAILNTLRADEAFRVLADMGISLPCVPNTQRWALLREAFEGLDPVQLHAGVVSVLKVSRSRAELEPFIKMLPKPLSAAILASDLNSTARRNLATVTRQPLPTVLAWS